MEAPELARKWQQRIDTAFPNGVIMTDDDESDGRTVSFPVPRPEVVAMRGMDPVVFVEVPQFQRNFSGVITSWEQVQESPCLVVRVVMDLGEGGNGRGESMRWSANLSPGMVNSLREWRHMSLKSSEDNELYQGAQPE
jgi:hypothetical protein